MRSLPPGYGELFNAVQPFYIIAAISAGRIPTEHLSAADWHSLWKAFELCNANETIKYPCGCSATGTPSVPLYCPQHGVDSSELIELLSKALQGLLDRYVQAIGNSGPEVYVARHALDNARATQALVEAK